MNDTPYGFQHQSRIEDPRIQSAPPICSVSIGISREFKLWIYWDIMGISWATESHDIWIGIVSKWNRLPRLCKSTRENDVFDHQVWSQCLKHNASNHPQNHHKWVVKTIHKLQAYVIGLQHYSSYPSPQYKVYTQYWQLWSIIIHVGMVFPHYQPWLTMINHLYPDLVIPHCSTEQAAWWLPSPHLYLLEAPGCGPIASGTYSNFLWMGICQIQLACNSLHCLPSILIIQLIYIIGRHPKELTQVKMPVLVFLGFNKHFH